MPPEPKKRRMRRLTNLRLSRVDVVPAGANPGAKITLFKQRKDEEGEAKMDEELRAELAAMRAELAAVRKEIATASRQAEPAPVPVLEQKQESLAKRKEQWLVDRAAEDAERSESGERPDRVSMFFAKKRAELGVSQVELAKSAGLTPQSISGIEHGRPMTYDTFSRLYESLGCTIEELRDADLP